jgi:hypothetical protein
MIPHARLVGGGPPRAPRPVAADDVERWYTNYTSEPLHWVMEANAQLIGNARLHSVDLKNRRARYASGAHAA